MQAGARSQNPGARRAQGRLESLDLETPGIHTIRPISRMSPISPVRYQHPRGDAFRPHTNTPRRHPPGSWILAPGSFRGVRPSRNKQAVAKAGKTRNFLALQSVLEIAIGLYEDGRA